MALVKSLLGGPIPPRECSAAHGAHSLHLFRGSRLDREITGSFSGPSNRIGWPTFGSWPMELAGIGPGNADPFGLGAIDGVAQHPAAVFAMRGQAAQAHRTGLS